MTQPDKTPKNTTAPALRFDWHDWLPYLEDSNIPDAQKQEFIETLWPIVLSFVDLGYHLNPTQEICGEVIDLKAVLEAAVLNSENTDTSDKGDAA